MEERWDWEEMGEGEKDVYLEGFCMEIDLFLYNKELRVMY